MALKVKLILLITSFLAVITMLSVGIWAATTSKLTITGSVSFEVADKTLYVKDVRLANDDTLSDTGETLSTFSPGFVNGNFKLDLGSAVTGTDTGSLTLYFDIINCSEEAYIAKADSTNTNLSASATGKISIGTTTPAEIDANTEISGTIKLILTVNSPATIDLSCVTVLIESYIDSSSRVHSNDENLGTADYIGTFEVGTDVTLTIDVKKDVEFLGWASDLAGNNILYTYPEYTFIVQANSPEHFYAIFNDIETSNVIYQIQTDNKEVARVAGSKSRATDIVIPTTIYINKVMYDVTSFASVAFSGNKDIVNVTINPSINNIYFYNCSNLQTVKMLEQIDTIPASAFNNCTSLQTVNIPTNVTTINNRAFYNCSSLTNIEIPKNVIEMGNEVFMNCTSLEEVVLPDTITSLGYSVFEGCSSLKSANIPKLITVIPRDTFYNCSSLLTIDISENVTTIGPTAFNGCTGVTEINYNAINATHYYERYSTFLNAGSKSTGVTLNIGEKVESIPDYFFSYVDTNGLGTADDEVISSNVNLVKVNFSNNSNLKTIGTYAFYRTKLTNISFPESLIDIGASSFSESSLTSVDISDSVTTINSMAFYKSSLVNINFTENSKLETIGSSAFSGCASITTFDMPDSVIELSYQAFSSCSSLATVSLSSSLTQINESVFYGCDSLLEINIPDNVVTIGVRAFSSCDLLNLVSTTNNSKLTTISTLAFNACINLTDIIIPNSIEVIANDALPLANLNFNLSAGGKYLGNQTNKYLVLADTEITTFTTFTINSTCKIIYSDVFLASSITEITIPNSVVYIGDSAFKNSGLVTVNMSNNVKVIENEAFSNTGLVNISLPNTLLVLDYGVFSYCDSLVSITLPTEIESIAGSLFEECAALETVVIPSNSKIKTIGSKAFYNCESLKNIVLPDSLVHISSYVFYGCKALTTITIPYNVNRIDYLTFAGSGLNNIIFENLVGWQRSPYSDFDPAYSIDLSDPSQNAIWFSGRRFYYNHFLRRIES